VKGVLTLAGNQTVSGVINRTAIQCKRHEEIQEAVEAMGFRVVSVVMRNNMAGSSND